MTYSAPELAHVPLTCAASVSGLYFDAWRVAGSATYRVFHPLTGAILGLGLAYAGTNREEVGELLGPLVVDGEVAVEVSAFAALALGLVFVSSGREEVVMNVLQVG